MARLPPNVRRKLATWRFTTTRTRYPASSAHMRRLIIRPGAIGDCIVSFPALESLRTEHTEAWVSSPVAPLVQFADRVCPISSTGLDLLGIEGLQPPDSVTN